MRYEVWGMGYGVEQATAKRFNKERSAVSDELSAKGEGQKQLPSTSSGQSSLLREG
jgi:hypothetical protein